MRAEQQAEEIRELRQDVANLRIDCQHESDMVDRLRRVNDQMHEKIRDMRRVISYLVAQLAQLEDSERESNLEQFMNF